MYPETYCLGHLRETKSHLSLASFSPIMVRLLTVMGDEKEADRWSQLISGSERGSSPRLIALASGEEDIPYDETAVHQFSPYLPLAAALDKLLSATDWAGPTSPAPAAWLAPNGSSLAGRTGETILASITAVAPTGTLPPNPVGSFSAVARLMQAGLEAETHCLAVEPAAAAGL